VSSDKALVDLSERVRLLIAQVRALDAPDDVLASAGRALDALSAQLEPYTYEGPFLQSQLRGREESQDFGGETDPHVFFPYSPIIGDKNPIAPPVRMWFDNGRMHGRAVFGAPYVGPPSMVHGGVIALTFDELLGTLGVALGLGGFTGTLSVRFERPTPLQEVVTMDAWHDRTEGRKVFLAGRIYSGEAVTASAEGIFVMTKTTPRGGT
jgi:acyl-coenzyme A thioesterase PaaI-like protein